MYQSSKRWALWSAPLLILGAPLCGSLIRFRGLPEGFGDFPPRQGPAGPGFSEAAFAGGVVFLALVALFFLVPRWFGFSKAPVPATRTPRVPLPFWTLPGALAALGCLAVFWGFVPALDLVRPYMSVPLWWGFIFFLDGLVFSRTGGRSLLATRPGTFALLALVSSAGWMLFEVLDYFVLSNWYYPNSDLPLPEALLWFLLCYSGILPQMVELTQLLQTFPSLAGRYRRGPVVAPTRRGYLWMIALGTAVSFLMGALPHELFVLLWIGPVFILWGALGLNGADATFAPLRAGNWTPLLLSSIAMLVGAWGWEVSNWGSQALITEGALNPSFWAYSIPYVGDVGVPFTEMPLLGFLGYVPFAWVCSLQWDWGAKTAGFDPLLEPDLESGQIIAADFKTVSEDREEG